MSNIISARYLKLGKNFKKDKNVLLGYKPERKLQNLRLIISDNGIIRSGSIIYAGTKIGLNLETGHNVVIREQNLIGDNLYIWNNSVIDYGCKIGNNVKIHCNNYIAQFTIIEDSVFIAPGVSIANDLHPGCKYSKKCMRGPTIRKNAKIGANATLLPFLTIGENCLIGAGSVVTKDTPPNSVVYGNPARVACSIYDLRCVSKITDRPFSFKVSSR